jgi:cell wall assembly regulator SMI1
MKTDITINTIKREIATFSDAQFVGGNSEEAIVHAEGELGLRFPPEYRAFLGELGCGSISSEEFIGLGGPQHLNVVWLTHHLRGRLSNNMPVNLIPLRHDGYGNYDCIDTLRPTDHGENEIVEYLHDEKSGERRQLNDSFFSWLLGIFKLIQALDAEENDE